MLPRRIPPVRREAHHVSLQVHPALHQPFTLRQRQVHPKPRHVAWRSIAKILEEDRQTALDYEEMLGEDQNISISQGNEPIGEVTATWEWSELNLTPAVLRNIRYSHARKVQVAAIQPILEGYDVIIQSEAGTGKTAAYLIPIIHRLWLGIQRSGRPEHIHALIISPTRELAIQLYEQAVKFAHNTGVKVMIAYGEDDVAFEREQLRAGAHILIGTSGKITHLIHKRKFEPALLDFVVLDEADLLVRQKDFQEELLPQLNRVRYGDERKLRQTMLVSATLEEELGREYDGLLREDYIRLKNVEGLCFSKRIHHKFVCIKRARMDGSLKMEETIARWIRYMTCVLTVPPRMVVFLKSNFNVHLLSNYLKDAGINVTIITSDRCQLAREEALQQFRTGNCRILLASDLIARGLDFGPLDYVFNAMMPNEHSHEQFKHRIGRVGRTRPGHVVTMFYNYPGSGNDRLLYAAEQVVQEVKATPNTCVECEFILDEQSIEEERQKALKN